MRHANQEHCIFARVGGRIVKGAPRMLLKHVVDVLHAGDVPLANAIHAFVQPANRRPQRDPVVPNFSVGLQFFEGSPECVVIDLLHPNVMQLKKINSICLQSV